MVIPTLIRLDRVDGIYSRRPRSLYFSHLAGFVLREGVSDGKVDAPRIGRLVSSGDADKLIGEVVEGAYQTLNHIAGDQGYHGRNWLDSAEIVDRLSRLHVSLGQDFIWVGRVERDDFGLQVLDVLFGPFDFRPDLS